MKLGVDTYILLLAGVLLATQLASADAVIVRKLKVTRAGDDLQLEFVLTAPITPVVTVANNPERIVLDLPTAVTGTRPRRVAVNSNGVICIRVALNSATPPITRAVIELDTAHPYRLIRSGNSVILVVLPSAPVTNRSTSAEPQPAGATPAAKVSLLGQLMPRPSVALPKSAMPATPSPVTAVDAGLHASFKVKYVAEGAAYLNGGRSSGLAEGMTLLVHDNDPNQPDTPNPRGPITAELRIVSVADNSSVAEIHDARRDVKPGDWAELSQADYARLGEMPSPNASASATPAMSVAPPTSARSVQNPPQSRMLARIGFDYSGITSSGSTPGSSGSIGLSFQTDMTQIAGTHWNLQGYWRGRFTTNSQPEEGTIEDYLDRTYIIQLFYDNPDSPWVAGVGRLYLPWAVSLDTIDGGYVGHKFGAHGTAGAFFGSTPNQATWNYRPDQQILGSFVNFEGGDYDNLHYTSTTGVAFSFVKWQLDRPYLFLENALSYGKYFSVYHSFIVDSPQGVSTDGITPGTGISRSYLTIQVQPRKWISLGFFHNYFRDVPTAATALVGTGLVDKLLYQGVNGTLRVDPIKHLSLYTTLGQSDKTGDLKRSWNQMYGLTLKDIFGSGMRADVHYSKFDSSFASGIYRLFSVSRPMGNRTMWNVQLGSQSLDSSFTTNQRSMFIDSSFDMNVSAHTFLQSGYTIEHGSQLNYSQWHLSLGYRFDAKGALQ